MKFNAYKYISGFYSVSLFIILGGLCLAGYAFYQRGPLDFNRLESVLLSEFKFQKMVQDSTLKDTWSRAKKLQFQDVYTELEVLETNVRSLSDLMPSSKRVELEEKLILAKNQTNQLIESPDPKALVDVMARKLRDLEAYFVENKWPTLTRIAQRTNTLVRSQTKNGITANTLKNLRGPITYNLGRMSRITGSSVLSGRDKSRILARIRRLDGEQRLLNSFVKKNNVFAKKLSSLDEDYKNWITPLGPKLRERRRKLREDYRMLTQALIAVVPSVLLLIVLGHSFSRAAGSRQRKSVEATLGKIIQQGILSDEDLSSFKLSPELLRGVKSVRQYLKKKLNLNQVFQTSWPFPAILLNEDLQLEWGNNHLYQAWGVKNPGQAKVPLTWDHFLGQTNLGGQDPIKEALDSNVSGIYQIQVGQGHEGHALPYEMYVSTIEVEGHRNILAVFYPLQSIEQTLANQAKSMIAPVAEALDSLKLGGIKGPYKEKLRKNFEMAGMGGLFEKMIAVQSVNNALQEELSGEVIHLESLIMDQVQFSQDLVQASEKDSEEIKQGLRGLNGLSELLVQSVDVRCQIEQRGAKALSEQRKVLKSLLNCYAQALSELKSYETRDTAFNELLVLKQGIKKHRSDLEDYFMALKQSFDHAILFSKAEGLGPKLTKSLNKVKIEIKSFEKMTHDFIAEFSKVDVHLSKIEQSSEEKQDLNIEAFGESSKKGQEIIDEGLFAMEQLQQKAHIIDDQIVVKAKEVHVPIQSSGQLKKEMVSKMLLNLGNLSDSPAGVSNNIGDRSSVGHEVSPS